ncbi:peptidoglycan-associated lipoprotein Pal [Fodinicurvata sediminis]|uniref:peptidoglycan-associated lipoprotein Pal n=1 Tax=Fodinicurvata sediminis TaxID=1121832 RepID=UPI0003B6D89E|nr:peptidoglycan-associated lipoprotein Pal [Fodinicurvata sediminis]
MRFAFLGVAAALLLAACQSTPSESDSASSDASASGSGSGSGSSLTQDNLGSADPGTQEDLEQRIGDRVFFDFDSSSVRQDQRRTVELLAEWMQRYDNVQLSIEGHADERGTREYNLALGERRANSVEEMLVALGVPQSRLRTISYGKERPAEIGSNEAAWAANRRAEFVVR